MVSHNWYAVIPSEILLDKSLSSTQKLLIALISNLTNEKGYCYASNKYLAECLNLSQGTISDNVSKLEELKLIHRTLIRNDKNQIESRRLSIVHLYGKNLSPLTKNKDRGVPKNQEVNNKVFNNKIIGKLSI